MSSIKNSLLTDYVNMEKFHVNDVLSIENESYNYPWSEKIFYDCIENNYLCRVLVLNSCVIGYVISSIIQNECHIMNLCIKNEVRNQGFGSYLLNELHNDIKKLNCSVIFLECRPSNASALSLYINAGYNEVGLRKNYYPAPNGHEDALILAKYAE